MLERMADALAELDGHRLGWFEATRQDAVESFPRLGRWRQSYHGIRVPVMDMVIRPLRRNLRMVAENFAADAALILSSETGRSAPSLELAGRGVELDLFLDPTEVDFVFKRGWLQASVPARRQFEDRMMVHFEAVYNSLIRAHLKSLMDEVLIAMMESEQPLAPVIGNTSLGG